MTLDMHGADAEALQVLALRSGDAARVARVLDPRNVLPVSLVRDVVGLLSEAPVAPLAMRALQQVAEGCVGALSDALHDARLPQAARLRVATVLGGCASQRAADALAEMLTDPSPAMRAHCARLMSAMRRVQPSLRLDRAALVATAAGELAACWRGVRRAGHAPLPGGTIEQACRLLLIVARLPHASALLRSGDAPVAQLDRAPAF